MGVKSRFVGVEIFSNWRCIVKKTRLWGCGACGGVFRDIYREKYIYRVCGLWGRKRYTSLRAYSVNAFFTPTAPQNLKNNDNA